MTSRAPLVRVRCRDFGLEQSSARRGEVCGAPIEELKLDPVVRGLDLCRKGGLAEPHVMEIDETVPGRQGACDRPTCDRDRLARGDEHVGELAITGHAQRQWCGQRQPRTTGGPSEDHAGRLEARDKGLDPSRTRRQDFRGVRVALEHQPPTLARLRRSVVGGGCHPVSLRQDVPPDASPRRSRWLHEGPDLYRVLQVDPAADADVIQAAYRVLARKRHPDLVGDGQGMKALNAAWEILGNAQLRARYDRERGETAADVARQRTGTAPSAKPYVREHAGPPPGNPSGSVVSFGRYEGWSIGEIARVDREFLEWLRSVPTGRGLKAEIETVLRELAAGRGPSRPFRGVRPTTRARSGPDFLRGHSARASPLGAALADVDALRGCRARAAMLISDAPPWLMNGSGMPVIGMIPMTIPTLTNSWNSSIAATPQAKIVPNGSLTASPRPGPATGARRTGRARRARR